MWSKSEQVKAKKKIKQMFDMDNEQVMNLSRSQYNHLDYVKLLDEVTTRLNTLLEVKMFLCDNETSLIFECFKTKDSAFSFRKSINGINIKKMIRKDVYEKCKEIQNYLISKNLIVRKGIK